MHTSHCCDRQISTSRGEHLHSGKRARNIPPRGPDPFAHQAKFCVYRPYSQKADRFRP